MRWKYKKCLISIECIHESWLGRKTLRPYRCAEHAINRVRPQSSSVRESSLQEIIRSKNYALNNLNKYKSFLKICLLSVNFEKFTHIIWPFEIHHYISVILRFRDSRVISRFTPINWPSGSLKVIF